jgi:hypothetical protein
MLSFGGLGDKLLAVGTNEDPINKNCWHIYYLTGAGTDSYPISAQVSKVGGGFYIINGIASDPLNNDLAYIFYTNFDGLSLRVLNVDFNSKKWAFTTLSLGSGSSPTVNTIIS